MFPNMRTIEAQITEHPWRTVAGAMALGALVALETPRTRGKGEAVSRTAVDAMRALVGALAMRWVRRVVLHNAGAAATQWYEQLKHRHGRAESWSPTTSADVH
jgi:hypothetical protein